MKNQDKEIIKKIKQNEELYLNKTLGCLLGGAAGDALGYEVEFLSEDEIFSHFGRNGITD